MTCTVGSSWECRGRDARMQEYRRKRSLETDMLQKKEKKSRTQTDKIGTDVTDCQQKVVFKKSGRIQGKMLFQKDKFMDCFWYGHIFPTLLVS